jgi:WhiB family redox-sensing transcriptional regulator
VNGGEFVLSEEFADMATLARLMARAIEAPEPWQVRALCAQTDPEAFFPVPGGSVREAKAVCLRCPVRAECLAFALAHDERHGVWGGMSEPERRALKRRQVTEPAAVPEGGEAA